MKQLVTKLSYMALSQDIKAPDFEAILHDGTPFKLSELKQPIVLYFYPKDDTPGCTVQACGLRDHYEEFQKRGVGVYGIGKGNKNSHKKFIEKYTLPFPLIVDEELELCKLFDVIKEKSMFGKKYFGIVRTTYIIDKDRTIISVMEDVNPLSHAKNLMEILDRKM